MKDNLITLTTLLIIMLRTLSVHGSGRLFIRLVRYENQAGRDWDNKCCDFLCVSPCDHALHLCLDDYHPSPQDHRNTDIAVCKYWKLYTGRLHSGKTNDFQDGYIGEFQNPKETSFRSWPGQVRFKVLVQDSDRADADDKVDEIYTTLVLKPAKSSVLASWQTQDIRGRKTRNPTNLKFQTKLYCNRDYYGEQCSVFCEAKDDPQWGHYTCNPNTGAKVCLPEYEEPESNCVIMTNDCTDKACFNGGTCIDQSRSFRCVCLPGYTGHRCQVEINHCESMPCKNNATCLSSVGKYICSCVDGYVGTNCEYHKCDVETFCANGGTCVGNGECYCAEGFTGERCDTDMCEELTCQNRGACSKGVCLCPAGYTGVECELGPCHLIQCQNNGTCTDGKCICTPGYVGDICQGIQNFCITRPCQNEGSCYSNTQGEGYFCLCKPGYTGINCDVKITTTTTMTTPPTITTTTTGTTTTSSKPVVNNGNVPNVLESVDKQPEPNSFVWWPYVVVAAGVLLVIAIIVIVILVIRNKRKARHLREAERGQSFHENPAYQTENIYENSSDNPTQNTTPRRAVPPLPQDTSDINLNIVPHDKVIYDVPRRQMTEAHGTNNPTEPQYAESTRRKSQSNGRTSTGGLKTPKHLEERYKAMQRAASTSSKE